mmetsp:Transcript_46573/g.131678  ORF Transcript_46573/g.131678 Transcript_46573/m.131678 type:complete len:93 (+) Transcript_46573:262-540(+)
MPELSVLRQMGKQLALGSLMGEGQRVTQLVLGQAAQRCQTVTQPVLRQVVYRSRTVTQPVPGHVAHRSPRRRATPQMLEWQTLKHLHRMARL